MPAMMVVIGLVTRNWLLDGMNDACAKIAERFICHCAPASANTELRLRASSTFWLKPDGTVVLSESAWMSAFPMRLSA